MNPVEWKEKFLTEAPEAWKAYNSFAARLQGRCITSFTTYGKDGKPTSSRKLSVQVKQNGQCRMYLNRSIPAKNNDSGSEIVYVENSAYDFSLGRRKTNDPWVVTELNRKAPGQATSVQRWLDRLMPLTHQLVWFSGQESALDLIRQPSFRVQRATTVSRNGLQVVEVGFDNTHSHKDTPWFPYQSGTIVVDPQHRWCVVTSRMRITDGLGRDANYETRRELANAPGVDPIPKKIVRITEALYDTETGNVRGIETYDYDLFAPTALPSDDEFTLSAFGLPEPPASSCPGRFRGTYG